MKNGYSAAPIALSDGLDIRVNTAVKNIKYFPGGVEVTAENLKTNNSTVTYKGEFSFLFFNVWFFLFYSFFLFLLQFNGPIEIPGRPAFIAVF